MKEINNYIIEKLKINKETSVQNLSDNEIINDSIKIIKDYLNKNEIDEEDYQISVHNDYYIFLIIYPANKIELEEIGEEIDDLLRKEDLLGDIYELGTTNKSSSRKKLIFKPNIDTSVSADEFNNLRDKRVKRF